MVIYLYDVIVLQNNAMFSLYAVIVHLGNIDSGHYYTYVKLGEEWMKMDDNLVIYSVLYFQYTILWMFIV